MRHVRRRAGFARRRRVFRSRRARTGLRRQAFRRPHRTGRRRFRRGGRTTRRLGLAGDGISSVYGRRSHRVTHRMRVNAIRATNRPIYWQDVTSGQCSCARSNTGWLVLTLGDTFDLREASSLTYNYGYGLITGDPPNAGFPSSMFLVDSMAMLADFKNNSTGDIHVQFYELSMKNNVPNGITPTTAMNSVSTDVAQQGAIPLTKLSYTELAFQPNDSPEFRAYFKIKKSKKYTIKPGKSFTYAIHLNNPKFIDCELIKSGNYDYLKGVSRLLLVRMYGEIGVADAGVTTGAAFLDFVARFKYTSYATPGLYAVGGYYSNSLPSGTSQPFAVNSVNGMPNLTWTSGTSAESAVIAHV